VEIEAWARSAFETLTHVPGVFRTGVALSEGGGRQLLFTASDRVAAPGGEWCEVDAYEDVPLNNAVRTGKPVVGDLEELSGRYPEFVRRQAPEIRALASVPISSAGRILGGFVLFYASPQPFDDLQLDRLDHMGKELGEDLHRLRGARPAMSRLALAEPLPAGARSAAQVVPPDPEAVAQARQFARTTLAAWGVMDETLDNAVLCISELVTNAIIHTGTGCEVRVAMHDDHVLTVTVRDDGTAVARPRSSQDDPLAVRGRGLQLVDALSARWGSDVNELGMTVWCRLDLA
jgi:anti-sigma regulatory factor (Ser/Thr protein kinase)